MLANEAKVFRKGGVSQHTVYTITPEIASDVNEFVFDIEITLPQEKSGVIATSAHWLHKQGHKASFESRSFLFKAILILQSYYILKEAKQYYSHQIHVRIYQVTLNMYMMSYYAKSRF